MTLADRQYDLGELTPLPRYRFRWDAARCDLCGRGVRGSAGIIGQNWRMVCYSDCRRLPISQGQSRQSWRQTGQWRFRQGTIGDPIANDPYVFALDAAICGFCGRNNPSEVVAHSETLGSLAFVWCCDGCMDQANAGGFLI